jgi:probable rRNA maturation factor
VRVELRVEVQKTVRAPLEPAFLRRVLTAALLEPAVSERLPGTALELTVRVGGDSLLRRLNRDFLGEDHPTDVLSFPAGERAAGEQAAGERAAGDQAAGDRAAGERAAGERAGPGQRPPGAAGSVYLGDLALSWPAVARQAAEHGHSASVEAALLAVHGLLHLLGWDHATPADEREMTRLTLACLRRAGVVPAGRGLVGPAS